jgi:hypothetical protein
MLAGRTQFVQFCALRLGNGREWVASLAILPNEPNLYAIVQICARGLAGVLSPMGETRARAAGSANWALKFNAEALRPAEDEEEIRTTGAADGILPNKAKL